MILKIAWQFDRTQNAEKDVMLGFGVTGPKLLKVYTRRNK